MEPGILKLAFFVLAWVPTNKFKPTKGKGKRPSAHIRMIAHRCPKCATIESTAPLA